MSYWIVQYMKNCVIIYLTMLVCIIISLCLCLMQINLYFYLLMRICVIILTKSAMRFQWEENTFSIDNFSYVHIIVYILTIVFLVRVARVCFYYVCLLYFLWDFNEVFVLSCLVFYWNISRFVFSLVFSIYIFFYRKTFLKYVLWLVFTQHGYSLPSHILVGVVELWRLTPLSTIFQLYRDGNRSTRRKPPIYHKSLTNFIT